MENIISGFETLLINCQNLDGLVMMTGIEELKVGKNMIAIIVLKILYDLMIN